MTHGATGALSEAWLIKPGIRADPGRLSVTVIPARTSPAAIDPLHILKQIETWQVNGLNTVEHESAEYYGVGADNQF